MEVWNVSPMHNSACNPTAPAGFPVEGVEELNLVCSWMLASHQLQNYYEEDSQTMHTELKNVCSQITWLCIVMKESVL